MQTAIFVSRTQSVESVVTLSRLWILVCCRVSFGDWVSNWWRMTPSSRSRTCTGSLTKAKDAKPLQAWIPSAHVWSNFVSPLSPQFLNQAPLRAQQLSAPDLLVVPHLEQTFPLLAVAAGMWEWTHEILAPVLPSTGLYIVPFKYPGNHTGNGGRQTRYAWNSRNRRSRRWVNTTWNHRARNLTCDCRYGQNVIYDSQQNKQVH